MAISVTDSLGDPQIIETLPAVGREDADDSLPMALSNQDFAAIGATNETAASSDTATSGLSGRLQRLAQRATSTITAINSLIALFPASLGGKTSANSLSITTATDDPLVTQIGEVQTTPTANTLLRRLKDLLSLIVLAAGTNLIGKVDHATTGIGQGSKSVTTAGTDVVLASSTPAKWVTIQARVGNTSYIAVGGSGVDATLATGNGVLLAPGDTITLPIDNLADVFVDSLVSGEGVRFVYGT